MMNPIFNEPVSLFRDIQSVDPTHIPMSTWINATRNQNAKHRVEVEQYRETKNKEFKRHLPAISPGAVMNTRKTGPNRIHHVTGWMQFDIDPKDNPSIDDYNILRDHIAEFDYVALCSLSCSGNGVWGLVRVRYQDRYREHFEQLKDDFLVHDIVLDKTKGGNPTDLRIYSYDPNIYVAEEFAIYEGIKPIVIRPKTVHQSAADDDKRSEVVKMISAIHNKRADIAPDYETYRNVSFAFASEFGESGRDLFHSVCSLSAKYIEEDADKQYTISVKRGGKGIGIKTFFQLCYQNGIRP